MNVYKVYFPGHNPKGERVGEFKLLNVYFPELQKLVDHFGVINEVSFEGKLGTIVIRRERR